MGFFRMSGFSKPGGLTPFFFILLAITKNSDLSLFTLNEYPKSFDDFCLKSVLSFLGIVPFVFTIMGVRIVTKSSCDIAYLID